MLSYYWGRRWQAIPLFYFPGKNNILKSYTFYIWILCKHFIQTQHTILEIVSIEFDEFHKMIIFFLLWVILLLCRRHYWIHLDYLKSRKSRNMWSNRQIWPRNAERSRAKTNRVLPRKCTGHTNTLFQQHKGRLYIWTSPDGQQRNQIDYILCSQKWRTLYSQQKQEQELTVAQIMNSLLPNSD